MFLITSRSIDVSDITSCLTTDEDGAIALFIGVVRKTSDGRPVSGLEYEAYEPMALASFEEIGGEIRERWGIERLGIVHRTGRLNVGEIAVVVGTAAPHRKEALAACAYAIDRLKIVSPIWKKDLVLEAVHA